MSLARTLAEGVGSWLHFEFACNRSGLFSEKYLSNPVGQILSYQSGQRAIAEFRHPVLADLMSGPGRRPEVDFVTCDPYPTVKYAVESKWIGTTRPSVESILWDLVRLELIAHSDGAECVFILGGQRRSLDRFFKSAQFAGPADLIPAKPLLRTDINALHKIDLVPTVQHRIPTLRKLFLDYQDFGFPTKIITVRSRPFPDNCTANQFQVYAWGIRSAGRREVFYPRNSRYYVAPGSTLGQLS